MSFLARVVLGDSVVHPRAAATGTAATPTTTPSSQPTTPPLASTARKTSGTDTHDNDHRTTAPTRTTITSATTTTMAAATAAAVVVPTSTLMLRVQTCTVAQDVREALHALEQRRDVPYVVGASEVATLMQLLRVHATTGVDDIVSSGGSSGSTDADVTTSTLHILANLGDVTQYAVDEAATTTASNGSSSSSAATPQAVTVTRTLPEQRRICDALLRVMLGEVGLLLSYVTAATTLLRKHGNNNDSRSSVAALWSHDVAAAVSGATYALRLLQRLQEHDMAAVHKQLLASHGLTTLLDVLQLPLPSVDDSEADAQQQQQSSLLLFVREAVVLLRAVAALDTEAQTLLAFDGAFDVMLAMAATAVCARTSKSGTTGSAQRSPRAADDADNDASAATTTTTLHDIAVEAVMTTQNMLRGNKATHKLFREMSCARHLCPLLTHRVQCVVEQEQQQQQQQLTASKAGLSLSSSSAVSLVTLTCVSMLASLLREADGDADVRAVQHNLLQCNVLPALTTLAMSGAAVDDGTRIEALRALAALLRRSRRCIDAFVRQGDVHTLVQQQHQQQQQQQTHAAGLATWTSTRRGALRRWSAPRALLAYLFTSSDVTLLGACVQVLLSLLSAEEAQPYVLEVLLRGLDASPAATTDAALATTTAATTDNDECGLALARALFAPPPTSTSTAKYYAAHLLDELLSLPFVAASLLTLPWPDNNNNNKTLTRVPLSFAMQRRVGGVPSGAPVSLFAVHVLYILCSVHGGGEAVDTAALAAYVRALLTWLTHAREAAAHIAQRHAEWYDELLSHARREDGAVLHVRLWCAAVAACVCVHAPAKEIDKINGNNSDSNNNGNNSSSIQSMTRTTSAQGESASSSLTACRCYTQEQLVERFVCVLGGPAFFDSILFDVRARCAQWVQPPPRALTATSPVLYDAAFVQTLQSIVDEFAALCARLRPATSTVIAQQQSQQQPQSQQPQLVATNNDNVNNDVTPSARAATSPTQPSLPSSAAAVHTRDAVDGRDDDKPVDKDANDEVTRLRDVNAQLRDELQQLHRRVDEAEARQRAAEEQQQQQQEAREKADVAVEDAAHGSNDDTVIELHELRERVSLLEEALHEKEDERQQLLQSLAMMELQLQRAASATVASVPVRHTTDRGVSVAAAAAVVPTTRQSCAVQHDVRVQTTDVAVNTHAYDDERGDGGDKAAELQQLREALSRVRDDCAELMCMVAELVERAATSAVQDSACNVYDNGNNNNDNNNNAFAPLHDTHAAPAVTTTMTTTSATANTHATRNVFDDDIDDDDDDIVHDVASSLPQHPHEDECEGGGVAAPHEHSVFVTQAADDGAHTTATTAMMPPAIVTSAPAHASVDNPFADDDDDAFDAAVFV